MEDCGGRKEGRRKEMEKDRLNVRGKEGREKIRRVWKKKEVDEDWEMDGEKERQGERKRREGER